MRGNMSTLNKDAYIALIEGDLEWLEKQPHSVEKMHIESILRCEKERLSIYKDCVRNKKHRE